MKKSSFYLFFISLFIGFSCHEFKEKERISAYQNVGEDENNVEKDKNKATELLEFMYYEILRNSIPLKVINNNNPAETHDRNYNYKQEPLKSLLENLWGHANGAYKDLIISRTPMSDIKLQLASCMSEGFSILSNLRILLFEVSKLPLEVLNSEDIKDIKASLQSKAEEILLDADQLKKIMKVFNGFTQEKLITALQAGSLMNVVVSGSYFHMYDAELLSDKPPKRPRYLKFCMEPFVDLFSRFIKIYDLLIIQEVDNIDENINEAKRILALLKKDYSLRESSGDEFGFNYENINDMCNKLKLNQYKTALDLAMASDVEIIIKLVCDSGNLINLPGDNDKSKGSGLISAKKRKEKWEAFLKTDNPVKLRNLAEKYRQKGCIFDEIPSTSEESFPTIQRRKEDSQAPSKRAKTD